MSVLARFWDLRSLVAAATVNKDVLEKQFYIDESEKTQLQFLQLFRIFSV
jgi:hypothetical protein